MINLGAQNVAIVDPSKYHYYQPGWTLVGGGIEKAETMCKLEKDQIPKNVDYIASRATVFDPDQNIVQLDSGEKVN